MCLFKYNFINNKNLRLITTLWIKSIDCDGLSDMQLRLKDTSSDEMQILWRDINIHLYARKFI